MNELFFALCRGNGKSWCRWLYARFDLASSDFPPRSLSCLFSHVALVVMSCSSSQTAQRTADASSALQALTRFFASATDRIGARTAGSQAGMQANYNRDPHCWIPPPPPPPSSQQLRGLAYGRRSHDLPPTPESSIRDELMQEIRTDLQSFVEDVQKHVTDELDRVKKQVLTSITKGSCAEGGILTCASLLNPCSPFTASRPSEEAVKLIKADDEQKGSMEEKLSLLEKDFNQQTHALERLESRLGRDRDAFSRNATLSKQSVEKQYKVRHWLAVCCRARRVLKLCTGALRICGSIRQGH